MEDADARSVYVGQVDYTTTPEELSSLFGTIGQIERVTILGYPYKPKGTAYVEFSTQTLRDSAIDLFNGTEFKGRNLKVTAKQATITGFTPIYPTYRGGRGGQGAFRGRGGRGRGGRGGALTIESPPAGNQDPHTPDISSSTSTQQQARDILNKNSATATASAAGVTVQLRASTQPKRNLPNDLSKNPPKKQKSLSSNIEEVQVLSFAEIIKRKRETEQALKEAQEGAIPPETNGDAESMSNEPTPKVMEDSESVRFEVNARILGTWEGSDDWYTGVITACHDDGTYDVLYDDGDVEQHKDPSGLQVAPDDEVEES